MISVPPAPHADDVFNAPPQWGAPAGFDPRKGHPLDPSWPDPGPFWTYWVAAPKPPAAAKASTFLSGVGVGRVVVGLLVAGFVVWRILGSVTAPDPGVGSCWKHTSGGAEMYEVTTCSDDSAVLKVVSQVTDESQCPDAADGYFKASDFVPSNTGIWCTVPM